MEKRLKTDQDLEARNSNGNDRALKQEIGPLFKEFLYVVFCNFTRIFCRKPREVLLEEKKALLNSASSLAYGRLD